MAFLSSPIHLGHLLLLLLSLFLIPFPSQSASTCTSQTFSNNKLFELCSDLPRLNSFLHWTYSPSNSSLSIAFVSSPAKTNGWIAWAINPTSTGMVGSQALIAFSQSNGSMTVQTFNISSYGPIKQSPISFRVSDLQAESGDGVMRIFATVEVPQNMTKINQVWQVGGSVTGGVPDKHEFRTDNLKAFGELDLLKGEKVGQKSNGTVPASTGENSTSTTLPSPSSSSSTSFLSFSSLLVGVILMNFWIV